MNKKSNLITVFEVAKCVGVSPSTVSRVFNNNYPVSNEIKQRVKKAALVLGYSPKTKDSDYQFKTIAVFIPNLQNPFYSSLVTGIEHSLRQLHMFMLLINTNGNAELEKRTLEQVAQNSDISGIIISSVCSDNGHIAAIVEKGKEVVILEQDSQIPCSSVGFNDEKCAEIAVQYLIDRGCRKLGFISSPLTRNNRKSRFRGFLSTLEANGIAATKKWIKTAKSEERTFDIVYEYQNGGAQIKSMIEEKSLPEAIFCGNDITAIGVLAALQRYGVRVPQDISVIGLDNIAYSEMCIPTLSTVDQCVYEIGGVAVQILHDTLNDPKRKRIALKMEPKLIIRESVL